jgi:hypothetical protein
VELVELFTGNGEAHHQGDKLLKVYLPITILVQILHDLVYSGWVLLGLRGKERWKE